MLGVSRHDRMLMHKRNHELHGSLDEAKKIHAMGARHICLNWCCITFMQEVLTVYDEIRVIS
jgi:hypothetical protein